MLLFECEVLVGLAEGFGVVSGEDIRVLLFGFWIIIKSFGNFLLQSIF